MTSDKGGPLFFTAAATYLHFVNPAAATFISTFANVHFILELGFWLYSDKLFRRVTWDKHKVQYNLVSFLWTLSFFALIVIIMYLIKYSI